MSDNSYCYELGNVEISYPEDFVSRYFYIEELIENVLTALVNKPPTWVIQNNGNSEKIFNLIVEAYGKQESVRVNMIIAALITLEPTYKAKFKLLGIAI